MNTRMFTEPTNVHRIRFYIPDNLRGIHCMSIDSDADKIAVVRRGLDKISCTSSIIEIWDICHSPCIEQKIFENDEEPALIEALCWGNNGRLFSCGGNGYVNEYDLLKGRVKQRHDISGGPIWCLARNPNGTKLVCGSEDGRISIIEIMEDGFGEVKRIGQMSTRILSITWMQKWDKIVVGSQEIISIYDLKSNVSLEKIQLDKGTLIWSLASFNNTIISGDSTGYTKFWNSMSGTLEKKYRSHQSGVLTIFVTKSGVVYSSGIDPLIFQFDAPTQMPLPPINAHTNDVRSIVVDKLGNIYSGGQDVDLVRTTIRPKNITKCTPDLSDCIKFWGNLLLLQYLKSIDIFVIDTNISKGDAEESPVKLLTLRTNRIIIASAVNQNWVVHSGYNDVKFMNVAGALKKVPHSLSFGDERTVTKMSFLDDKTLALCTASKVHVLSLAESRVTELAVKQFDHRIVALSTCTSAIGLVTSNSELIYIPKGDWTPVSVSKIPSIPTAMSFNRFESKKFYVCTSNKTLMKFNLESHNLKMDKSTSLTKLESDQYFRGISFTPKSLLMFTTSGLCSLDPSTFSLKSRIQQYKSILAINTVLDKLPTQVILVELPDEQLVKLLPPAFLKRVFGAE